MQGIERIPISLLFEDPMEIEHHNSAPWNVFRIVFDIKKCKFTDLTQKSKDSLMLSEDDKED